jgi:WD40 repeat protein
MRYVEPTYSTPFDSSGCWVKSLSASPSGRWLFGAGRSTISDPGSLLMWDSLSRQLLKRVELPGSVGNLCVSADSSWLAVAHVPGTHVHLWKTQELSQHHSLPLIPSGSLDLAGNIRERTIVGSLCFSPNGKHLAAGCWDLTAKVWNLTTGELHEFSPDHRDNVDYVGFLNGGQTLMSATAAAIRVWRLSDGSLGGERRIRGGGYVWRHALSPDTHSLVSMGLSGALRVWDTRSWKYRKADLQIKGEIFVLKVAPDNRTVAIGSEAGYLHLFDTANMKATRRFRLESGLLDLAFLPSGNHLVCALSSPAEADRLAVVDLSQTRRT